MIDICGKIKLKDKEYNLYFNLNVMEAIQTEYGTVDDWGALTDGSTGEPNAKAVIYGLTAMINEGIEISNDENGTQIPLFTHKQIGRLVDAEGLQSVANAMNDTIIQSTESTEKNA